MANMLLLWDIGLIIVAATFFAYIFRILRQPLILAYVLAGTIIGPVGLNLIYDRNVISVLSELGIAFFLFIVGLELDPRRLKDVGLVTFVAGAGQVSVSFLIGFAASTLLGFSSVESLYIALTLSFASTMIVVKLLSDKNELDTMHGRITLGILLIQDVVAIIVLAFMNNVNNLSLAGFSILAVSLIKGLGLFSIAIVFSRFILPSIFGFIAKSQELLFLSAVSWCFIFAVIANYEGFSIAVGSFLAGVSLASFPYNVEIVGRIRSLRDFFATIFFVSLGMQVIINEVSPVIYPIIIFTVIVVLGNPLIVMFLVSRFGYGRRTSFLTAAAIAQVSEFSLILAALGLQLGHVSHAIVSMVTVIAMITITITSYVIKYDDTLYRKLSNYLRVFERVYPHKKEALESIPHRHKKHVIVCGSHRMGYHIVKALQKLGKELLVVEFDPEIIKSLMAEKIHCIYGDIGDIEILERIDLKDAELVISTIPREEDNILLIKETKRLNPHALVFVTADTMDQALELYSLGADYVFIPRVLSGEKAAELVEKYVKNISIIRKIKERHILELEHIKEDELLKKYEPSFLRMLIERGFTGSAEKEKHSEYALNDGDAEEESNAD